MVIVETDAAIAQLESQRLVEFLATLSLQAMAAPSACDRWAVRDVVAHLVRVADFYADSVSRGIRGDPAPPGEGRARAGTAASSSESIARGAVAASQELGDDLLSRFEESSDRLNRILAGLDAGEAGMACYHSARTLPARNFIDLRVMELSVHGWDIRSALEPETHLADEAMPSLMNVILLLSRWIFWPAARLSTPLRYRFEVAGPIAGGIDVVAEGDRAEVRPADEAPANVTLRCDSETFVFLMFGRANLGAAIADGRIVAEGDVELAGEFGRWFKGI